VRLPGGHGCGNASRPLPNIPAGLEGLREMLPRLFAGHCEDSETIKDWVQHANFILVDLTLGQALLVGTGLTTVIPDNSMPSLKEDGTQAKLPEPASEHLIQGQRLSRWLRKLPDSHRGWIAVADEALPVWKQRFVDSGRRLPLVIPACISKSAFGGGSKFRLTPGTTWCGDSGWSHVGHFKLLWSKTNVPEEKRVPICIALNKNGYAYRFENSVTGCIGKHKQTGTVWTHVHTVYTSTDARGDMHCVGFYKGADKTRWVIQKASKCNAGGFEHSFSFRAMTNDWTSPLATCCLMQGRWIEDSSVSAVQRLACDSECETASGKPSGGRWKLARKLVLLSRKQSDSDHRLCIAWGFSTPKGAATPTRPPTTPPEVWTSFRDSACDRKKLVTHEGEHTFHWDVSPGPEVYLPRDASGVHFCLCHFASSTSQGSRSKPYYTWVQASSCPEGGKKETCFNTLGPADVLKAVQLVDEMV